MLSAALFVTLLGACVPVVLGGTPEAAPAESVCEEVVTAEMAQELYAALMEGESGEGCRLDGLAAKRSSMRLKWQAGGGARIEVDIVPASCAPPGARVRGAFAVLSPHELDRLCGPSSEALSSMLSALSGVSGEEAPRKLWDPEIWSPEVAYLWLLLPLLWVLLLLASAAGLWQRRSALRPDKALLAVTGLGLALRVILPPFGPGDFFNSLADAYRGLAGVFEMGRYGRAPDVLLAMVFGVTGPSDDVVIALNLAAGTASIPLLACLARRLGHPRWVALTAALLLAVAPLHVRFSPTYNRYILLVALMLAGWTLLLAWIEERRPADLCAATCALALGPQCRPDGMVLPAVTVALLVACSVGARLRRSRGTGLAAWAAVGLHLLVLVPPALAVAALVEGLPQVRNPAAPAEALANLADVVNPEHNAFLSAAVSPRAWIVLPLLGLAAPPGRRILLLLWLAAGAVLATAAVTAAGTANVILNARYHLMALPFYLLLSAGGVMTLWKLIAPVAARVKLPVSATRPALALIAAGLASLVLPEVTRDTTLNAEYRFLREHLAKLEDGCVILSFDPQSADLGFRPDETLSISSGREHTWVASPRELDAARVSGAAYYHAASCGTLPRVEAPLAEQEEICGYGLRHRGEAIATADLPVRTIVGLHYRRDPVSVGLYRLKP